MTVFVFILAIVAGGWFAGAHIAAEGHAERDVRAATDARGFIALPALEGVDPDVVTVISVPNCPSAEQQRIREFISELADRGVPYKEIQNFNAVITNNITSDKPITQEEKDRIDEKTRKEAALVSAELKAVMSNGAPIVFVHGRGKSGVTVDEVVAEYDGSSS